MDNFEGSSSKYFRESFKGFNKDDVIQFVTKMIKEYSEAEENYKEEISQATENMLKKTQETTKLKKEIDALKADMQKKSNDATAIQKKYTVLFEEYERQRAVIDALPGDVKLRDELNKKIDNLNTKLSESESKLKNSESKLSNRIKELEQFKNKLNENEIKLNENEVKLIESEADKKFLLDVIKKFELETNVRVKDICDVQSLNDKKITFENNMIDMAKASKKIVALEEELSTIKKRNQELIEAKSNVDELSSDEEKIYEKITAELGNVIYSANRTAENIIAKATNEAEDIMNEVNIKRAMFLEAYERDVLKSKESFELLQNEYRIMAEKFKNSYETFSGELSNVDRTLDRIHDKFSTYQNNKSESN